MYHDYRSWRAAPSEELGVASADDRRLPRTLLGPVRLEATKVSSDTRLKEKIPAPQGETHHSYPRPAEEHQLPSFPRQNRHGLGGQECHQKISAPRLLAPEGKGEHAEEEIAAAIQKRERKIRRLSIYTGFAQKSPESNKAVRCAVEKHQPRRQPYERRSSNHRANRRRILPGVLRRRRLRRANPAFHEFASVVWGSAPTNGSAHEGVSFEPLSHDEVSLSASSMGRKA